jgi:hypothetical protein
VNIRRTLVYGCTAAGALLGLVLGYRFGREISGPGLGVLLAINAGLFGGLLVAMLMDRLALARPASPPPPDR